MLYLWKVTKYQSQLFFHLYVQEMMKIYMHFCILRVTNATANSNLYQCCSGLCIDLLKYLSDKIGFEYDLFQVEDRKFGAYDKVLIPIIDFKILWLS